MDDKSIKIYIGAEATNVGNIMKLSGALYRALEDEGVLLDVLSAYEGEDPKDCQRSLMAMIREATLGDGNIMRDGTNFLMPLNLPEHVQIDGPVHRSIEKCALNSEMSIMVFAHTLKDDNYAAFAFTSEDNRLIGDCKETAFGDGFVEISKLMGTHAIGAEIAILEGLVAQHFDETNALKPNPALGGP